MALCNRPVLATVFMVALSGSSACAAITRSDGYQSPILTIQVQNRGWEDVTLYLVRSGAPIRIGRVNGLSSTTLLVPAATLGNGIGVRIVGRMRLSNEEFVSDVVDLYPGVTARLVVEEAASLSHVVLR